MEYTKLFYPYLFCWDKVPGNDSGRLIDFLKDNYSADWAQTAKIEKIDDGKTIEISVEKNCLSLSLNNEKTTVNLTINNIRIGEFNVTNEDGKLNVSQEISQKALRMGDRCDGSVYVYNEKIILAVNIAFVTGRPLLVRGPSGCGKSSLAQNVAKVFGCPYLKKVISSRTQARDLLYEVDLLRRLQDAQAIKLEPEFSAYIKPGILWWAFDPDSAQKYSITQPPDIFMILPNKPKVNSDYPKAVVLLDEIDKADPDVPNNLLDPIGSLQFQVEEIKTEIQCKNDERPLIIITTNDERELPPAFLRRCVELKLENPFLPVMLEIGKAHFPTADMKFLEKVAKLLNIPESEKDKRQPAGISPAEFIDTLKACIDLKIGTESKEWEKLTEITIWKHGRTARN